MQNSKINFGTEIILRDSYGFMRAIRNADKSVGFPYTKDQIRRGPRVLTRGVDDCSAGGIITLNKKEDCFDITKIHIDPHNSENDDFQAIKDKIYQVLDGDEPIQAFLFGCKSFLKRSIEVFDNFFDFITTELKIPCSKFKGSCLGGSISSVYDGYKKELTLCHSTAEERFGSRFSVNDISKIFKDVEIASGDHVSIDKEFGRNMDVTDAELCYLMSEGM